MDRKQEKQKAQKKVDLSVQSVSNYSVNELNGPIKRDTPQTKGDSKARIKMQRADN